VEAAIISMLLADASVAAIVGTRVYPLSRPQGSAFPSISLFSVDGGPEYADDGETGHEVRRVQVDGWAMTYTETKAIAAAVRNVLSFFFGTAFGVFFAVIILEDERDFREGGGDQTEYPFHVTLDFVVTTGEAP